MSGFSHCVATLVVVLFVNLCSTSFATDLTVKFDVPALVCVSELEKPQDPTSSEKIVEVVIPVSTQIRIQDRENVEEFRFDIFWNRNAYPLVDYGPRTQTTSDIEGLISIEKSQEKNGSLGLNLSGKYELISGSAKAELSKRNSTKTKYQEVPEHDVLVASGSTRRGTGAFFRFHPSRRDILEGGRELILAFRVPNSWRGGILKIECRATGNRKVLGAWKEPFEENRAFVVPVHLQNDEEARRAAVGFVQSEQDLRTNWNKHQRSANPKPASPFFAFASKPTASHNLPEHWAHLLIQSGNDNYLAQYRPQIPRTLASAADQFVNARQDLLKLSR